MPFSNDSTVRNRHLLQAACVILFCSFHVGCGRSESTVLHFRGQDTDQRCFAITGPGGRQFVTRTTKGWTISVPEFESASESNESIGLTSKAIIHGDFRLQAAYEIETVDESASESGTGPSLYVATDANAKHAAQIARLNRSNEGTVVSSAFLFSDKKGRRRHDISLSPNESTKGWLCLQRRGERLFYSCKDLDSEWTELREVEFGKHPISTLRVALERGGSSKPFTMHWTEISLELNEVPLSWQPSWQRRFLFVTGTLALPVFLVLVWLAVDSLSVNRRMRIRII